MITVIYNQEILNTEATRFLSLQESTFHLVLFDNSSDETIVQHNQNTILKTNVIRLGTGVNQGLSKAYSESLDTIKRRWPDVKWILILDQDTILNETYYDEILKLVESEDPMIFYPTVFTLKGILSPKACRRQFLKILDQYKLKTPVQVPINSGILWHINLLKEIRFDQAPFLDLVDFDFFFQLYTKYRGCNYKLMNSKINQNFSGETKKSMEADLFRFNHYVTDFTAFCKKWKVSTYYRNYVLIKRSVRLNWIHKTVKFTTSLYRKR